MRDLVLCSLFALIVLVGFIDTAVAFEQLGTNASVAASLKAGHMADIPAWLVALLNYLGIWGNYNGGYNQPNGSVPIPGTLLLFGVGFGGLLVWRAVR